MPLTPLQKDVLAILAGNRSEESHFAGGIVLNAAEDSARIDLAKLEEIQARALDPVRLKMAWIEMSDEAEA